MTVTSLSDIQHRILTELAMYRFLTTDHMLRLRISADRSKSRLYRNLQVLEDGKRPLTGHYAPHPIPGVGKLASIHYLTPHGAKVAAGLLDIDVKAVKHPRGRVLFRDHYHHVVNCVGMEATVRLWAGDQGHTVDFFHSYLDVTGANNGAGKARRQNQTKIHMKGGGNLIPDGIFKMTDPEGVDRLFVLEVHNQMRTKRIHDRLADIRYALGDETIERQFAYDGSPRILTVFEDENALQVAMARLGASGLFRGFEPFFYLSTHARAEADFRHGWRKIDDTRATALF